MQRHEPARLEAAPDLGAWAPSLTICVTLRAHTPTTGEFSLQGARRRPRPRDAQPTRKDWPHNRGVKLARGKRGHAARTRSDDDADLESARASLALREQELAKARSALDAEREERDALELALESERKQRAKLERQLARADRKELAERALREPAAGGKRAGAKRAGAKRTGAKGNGGKQNGAKRAAAKQDGAKPAGAKGNGAEPKRGKAESWKAARRLAAEGFSQREIARRLELNTRTVARLVAADQVPRYRRAPAGSMLDPLEPVMRSVLREQPGIGAPGMTEVLRTHGYRGSVDLVRRRLRVLRAPS